jgi:hypothetical protein
MKRIQPHSLGMIVGIQLAGWHAGWSFRVWIGWAQWLVDFVLGIYMLTPALQIAGFNFLRALSIDRTGRFRRLLDRPVRSTDVEPVHYRRTALKPGYA